MPETAVALESIDKATARFFRVLGDPTRIRIISLLASGPKNVSEIVEQIGLSQARISTHLACLRWCEFVEAKKIGRQVEYSLNDPSIEQLLTLAKQMASVREQHLASCTRIGPDWI